MGGILRMAACVLRSFFTDEYIIPIWVVALRRRTQYDQLTQPVVTIYHNTQCVLDLIVLLSMAHTMMRVILTIVRCTNFGVR